MSTWLDTGRVVNGKPVVRQLSRFPYWCETRLRGAHQPQPQLTEARLIEAKQKLEDEWSGEQAEDRRRRSAALREACRRGSLEWIGIEVQMGVRRRLHAVAMARRHEERRYALRHTAFLGLRIGPNFNAWWWKL